MNIPSDALYACTKDTPVESKLAAALRARAVPLYVIGWTKPKRHTQKYLQMTEDGRAIMTKDFTAATRLSREEVNAVLLALHNAGRWSEGGEGSYPEFAQAS